VRVATGTYIANDVGQSIIGLGFAPVFVITRSLIVGETALKTSAMPGTVSIDWGVNSEQFTDAILSLDGDGFTVGTNFAANDTTRDPYHWMAFGADPNLSSVSYLGTGFDSVTIPGVGFQPDVLLGGASPSPIPFTLTWFWWVQSLGGDNSMGVNGFGSPQPDRFQAVNADGFEVGQASNISNADHFVTAWRVAASNIIAQGRYTGNGVARSFNIGFRPAVWRDRNFSTQNCECRPGRQGTSWSAKMWWLTLEMAQCPVSSVASTRP